MTDDIVGLLKAGLAMCECSGFSECDRCFVDGKAIAEIERLRSELADWQRTVRALEAEKNRLERLTYG